MAPHDSEGHVLYMLYTLYILYFLHTSCWWQWFVCKLRCCNKYLVYFWPVWGFSVTSNTCSHKKQEWISTHRALGEQGGNSENSLWLLMQSREMKLRPDEGSYAQQSPTVGGIASWDTGHWGCLTRSNVLLCQHRPSKLVSKGWALRTKESHLIYPCKQVTETKKPHMAACDFIGYFISSVLCDLLHVLIL
jgi:hypothetical protein